MKMKIRKPPSMDEMMNEISGFVSYIEEVSRPDPSKTASYSPKVKELADRLAALGQKPSEKS